jgi:hypothetical protein
MDAANLTLFTPLPRVSPGEEFVSSRELVPLQRLAAAPGVKTLISGNNALQ